MYIRLLCIIVMMFLSSLRGDLICQTNVWIGGNSFWAINANWSLGHIPTSGEDVEITAIDSKVTIQNNTDALARTLVLSEILNITVDASLTLSVNNDSIDVFVMDGVGASCTVNGKLAIMDTKLSCLKLLDGIFQLTGFLTISEFQGVFGKGVEVTADGVFVNNGDIDVSTSFPITSAGILNKGMFTNNGIIQITGASVHNSSNNTLFTNLSTLILTNAMFFNSQNAEIKNLGQINIQGSGEFLNRISGVLSGTGTITSPQIVNRANIEPGNNSIGTLTFNGFLDNDKIGTSLPKLRMGIDGPSGPGVINGNDQIVVIGDVDLDSDLNLIVDPNYEPNLLDTFILVTYTGQITSYFDQTPNNWVIDTSFEGQIRAYKPCFGTPLNSWIADTSENDWHGAANWFLGIVPDPCSSVLVPFSNDSVRVQDGNLAVAHLLEIHAGIFEVESGAELIVVGN